MAPFENFMAGGPALTAFAPGRTELAGNHVDHQGGLVVAGAITQGLRAEAVVNGTGALRVSSGGFEPFTIAMSEDLTPCPADARTSRGLAKGLLAQMLPMASGTAPGIDIRISSDLPAGSGLSSSAAFELLIGQILNTVLLDGALPPDQLALMAQAAERDFFGKPCGLMDQMAIATGGIAAIDFKQEGSPSVRKIPFSFQESGYSVVLATVGASHAGEAATASYARIPQDMAQAARLCGSQRLGDVREEDFLAQAPAIREAAGDDVFLRAAHFFREQDLARRRITALEAGDARTFTALTAQSGASSAQYLQNVSVPGSKQPAMAALCFADLLLDQLCQSRLDQRGAVRIHGGGFGGSIQAVLPASQVDDFCRSLDEYLGAGSCTALSFSPEGAWARWL